MRSVYIINRLEKCGLKVGVADNRGFRLETWEVGQCAKFGLAQELNQDKVSQRNPSKWPATAQCRKKTARQFQFQQCAADGSPTGESNQQKEHPSWQPEWERATSGSMVSGLSRRPERRLSIEELQVGAILFRIRTSGKLVSLLRRRMLGVKGRRLVAFLKAPGLDGLAGLKLEM
jgi:hypothetical protein